MYTKEQIIEELKAIADKYPGSVPLFIVSATELGSLITVYSDNRLVGVANKAGMPTDEMLMSALLSTIGTVVNTLAATKYMCGHPACIGAHLCAGVARMFLDQTGPFRADEERPTCH
jgi:hypothetical protein